MASKRKTEQGPKSPQPMDPQVREVEKPVAYTNNRRNCYALDTLVKEVLELFPETKYEVSEYDVRNSALAVTFWFGSGSITGGSSLAGDLLALAVTDDRIDVVEVTGLPTNSDEAVYVRFLPSARTKDSRATFSLAEAWDILEADMEFEFSLDEDGGSL